MTGRGGTALAISVAIKKRKKQRQAPFPQYNTKSRCFIGTWIDVNICANAIYASEYSIICGKRRRNIPLIMRCLHFFGWRKRRGIQSLLDCVKEFAAGR